jgi:hypothetical protein
MTDPLSIATGVLALAKAAGQVSNCIYSTISKMTNAPFEMHEAAKNMTFLASIFEIVANAVKTRNRKSNDRLIEQLNFVQEKFARVKRKADKIFERKKLRSITT